MLREGLIFVGTCDIAGLVRGKGFPARALKQRQKTGVGWTHSNLMQTCFGPIFDTPFGTAGDLMIVPDPAAEVDVDFGDGSAPEHFILGDIRNTDGSAWECCPREFLRRGAASLKEASGLELLAGLGGMEELVVSGVELDEHQARVTLLNVPDRPGYASRVFRAIADADVNVDMIVQNVRTTNGDTRLSITVPRADADRAARAASAAVGDPGHVLVEPRMAKLSVVGIGMRSHAGVAAKMFRTLAEVGINIQMIATSEIKTSVVVDAKFVELAVRVLHDAFIEPTGPS